MLATMERIFEPLLRVLERVQEPAFQPMAQALAFWAMASLAVVVVAWLAGLFGSRGLGRAPLRRCRLEPVDLLVVLGIYLLGQVVMMAVVQVVVGSDRAIADLSPRMYAWIAVLGTLLVHLPMVGWILYRAGLDRDGLRELGLLPRGHPAVEVGAGVLALLAAAPLVTFAALLGMAVASTAFGVEPPPIGHELLEQMRAAPDWLSIALMLGVALVAAPLLEEIVFRGLLHNALARVIGQHRRWGIILLSAAVFTVIHLGAVVPYALGSLLMLAIVLGWLYERTGSLWPPIVVHFLFNALNTIMAWQVDLEMPVAS